MAEAIPYGVATSLINTLASLAFKEISSIHGVETEIQRLKQTVEGIKAVLADADAKQQTDQLIQLWIRNLKRVLYEADDLLDEIQTQYLLHKRDAKGKVMGKVRDFFSSSNPVAFRSKIARKIREIGKQFNAVAETMANLNLDPRVVIEMKHEKCSDWRETSSKHEENIIGREKSEKEVIDLLLNTDNKNERVSLVAIVGIGGLGKTALAQLVYNNAKANKLFDKQMWVCVSEEFEVKALVKRILESSTGTDVKDQQLELLQNNLEQNLNGKRYLLVLDDVWNEDGEKWLQLKKYLMCGAQGSKILVTTRDQTVSNIMGVKTPYLLKGLTNDQSWTLMKRLAFRQDQIVTPNLESIGEKIAEKCAGLPLAIRVMGTLLQSKARESEWEDILESDFWKQCKGDDSIMPILKLSYDSLAIELKQCFAYCSLYPKDHRYNKEELIYLWMAQGFLESEDEEQCPEDVGEDYVRTLLMKSFLQDVETDGLSEIKYFKMHDLMHDLSATIASCDYCMYVERRKNVMSFPIHASFIAWNSDSSLNMLDPDKLRTLLFIETWTKRKPFELHVFKRLRGADLSSYKTKDLSKSISKMSHLRYINLFNCRELSLKSISNLVNLQTLILDSWAKNSIEVDMITKLINLRRLHIICIWMRYGAFEDGMPVGLGRMANLQRLSHFVVGNAKLNELKELNLRGELTITKLDLVRDVEEESKDVNLRAKKKLISLNLHWGLNRNMKKSDSMQLLKNLQPHQNLKALRINSYPGESISDWIFSCKNLVELKFFDIENCQYLPPLEGFVSLKTLRIESMDKLEGIHYKGSSSSSANFFPSLEELRIIQCLSLRGWLKNTRDNDERHHSLPPFSRLSSLEIYCCPNLSCMPTFPNLVSDLTFYYANRKPLLDTLHVKNIVEPSTLHDVVAPLSMLKSLIFEWKIMEPLQEEWMQNLSSLKHLSIWICSSPEKLFRQMQNLSATLEELTLLNLNEDCNIKFQDRRWLHSLQKISFDSCYNLVALPLWICDLQSLRVIKISFCRNLEFFPEGMNHLTNLQTIEMNGVPLLKERCERETGAEWPKIAYIPNILIDKRPI